MTLSASTVSWSAGGALIVDSVSVELPAGRFVGVVGPNGSGKSSLLRCIAALRAPDAGTVRLDGVDVRSMGRRAMARRLAVVEQDAPTDVPLSVIEVVLLARTPHRGPWDGDRQSDIDLARDALAQVGMEERAERSWPTLSGGERQRVRIARALAQQPEVLLLDEPTNHLDIAHQLDVLALVRGLGIAVLAALHDLNHAAMFCDELLMLDQGRIVASGPPAAVLTRELIGAVYDVDSIIDPHPDTGTPHIVFRPRSRS